MNPISIIPRSITARFARLLSFSSDHAFAAEPER